MNPQNFRYPGVQPFQREQSDRFFGRDEDITRFLSLILQEKLVVLYGKSGYGKSSLLNAGIQPRLDQETAKGKRRYVAVPIRFLAAGGQDEDNLFEQFEFHLSRAMEAAGISKSPDAALLPNTLWGCFKTWQTDLNTVFVLLFDQFEELFSYKPEQQLAFRQQLAELLYSDYPQFLEENEANLPPETAARLAEKTNVHTVLAIRADRVSELDRLRDHLPKIREKWFELRALPLEEARKALTIPSELPGDFASSAFQFDQSAQKKILDFLRDAEGLVEPNQLQILAESFERRVILEGLRRFDTGNIGDLRVVIARYYSDKIAAIEDPAERLAVRRLCEEGLAQEGEPPIRLSLHAAQIRQFFGVETPLLARLVDVRLLRAEAGKGGGATYELPHDTLLGAVLEAKKVRLEEERKAELERQAAQIAQEKAEAERRRKRALVTAAIAAVLVLAAIVATVFAFNKSSEAERQAQNAAKAIALADQKTREATVSDSLAQVKTAAATTAEQAAQLQKDIADLKRREAKTATEQALLRKKVAELAALQAVVAIVSQARQDILRLDYEAAFSKLKNAASLNAVQDSVAFECMEIAFFYHHTHQNDRDRAPYDLAAGLLGKNALKGKMDFDNLNAGRARFLKERYFPNIQPLPGGTFLMGRDSTRDYENYQNSPAELPRHEVQLSPFGLAATETTFWQWAIYITDKKRDLSRYAPTWGIAGDNPAVNLDWFDACEYANWLSRREGKKPFYEIDSTAGPKNRESWKVELQPDGNGYRLPTEAEWEYAARGGPDTPYYIYAGSDDIGLVGWYGANSKIGGVTRTHPVGQKQPVVFTGGKKIFDLSGNVLEWCWDGWDENNYEQFRSLPAKNPTGLDDWTIYRVLRGGSWDGNDSYCRSAFRYWVSGYIWYYDRGFRLARHQN